MRAAYHLAIAVFSLGAVAIPTTAPNATDDAGAPISGAQRSTFLATAPMTAESAPMRTVSQRGLSLVSHFSRGALIGKTLPEDIELHPISRHETYRYAVMNSRRVIVDAASRRVVYVVQ